jgi:hypothetical protein
MLLNADLSGSAVRGVLLWPLACWDYRFEFRLGHGCLSPVSAVCCQVKVSAVGRSLVQKNPTDCGVSEYDREDSKVRRPWPTAGCQAVGRENKAHFIPKPTAWLRFTVNFCHFDILSTI